MKIVKYCLVLSVLALFVAFGSLSYSYISNASNDEPARATADTETPIYIDEQELWTLIGNYKQENSLQVPVKDESLCKVARMRLGMISEDWSHGGFSADWVSKIHQYTDMWENLAKNQVSAKQVLNEWTASTIHNSVLLKNYKNACVECANINGTNYCVYLSAI